MRIAAETWAIAAGQKPMIFMQTAFGFSANMEDKDQPGEIDRKEPT